MRASHEAHTNQQIIDWIRGKKKEIESKKEEYDQMLNTLSKMLEYRTLLIDDPQKAQEMLKTWHLLGPLFYRRWFSREPIDDQFVKAIIKRVLASL
ncbi:hypothetical protein [Paenibacillus elgii]|uniref:hypothetical protein n=1 Tax=Paenibacillus elgii TaxID=189691 RepID=UPI0030DBAB09